MSYNIQKAREWAYTCFEEKENMERKEKIFEIDFILAYVLNWDRARLYAYLEHELDSIKMNEFKQMIRKRKEGIPLNYLTGKKEFMGFEFYVNSNVLIPRPETELIVEEGLKKINYLKEKFSAPIFVLEPFTGCGAISLSLAMLSGECSVNELKIYAGDISDKALKVATRNRDKLKIKEKTVDFFKGDLFSSISRERKFHLILANPPYIPANDIKNLSKEVNNEPRIALDGGVDGLDYYRKIKKEYKSYLLCRGGIMLLEIGENQEEQVTNIFSEKNVKTRIIKDLGEHPRILEVAQL